jgi:hypothetical protein
MKLAFLKRDPTLVSENVHDQRKILDSENFEFNIFSYRSVVNIYAHICRGMGRVEGGHNMYPLKGLWSQKYNETRK